AADSVLELAFALRAVKMALRFCDESVVVNLPKFVAADSNNISHPSAPMSAGKHPLLHICDPYDTAFCLRVLGILHHGHVQFFLAFAERDVGCAITRPNLKYVEKLAVRR